jgi:UDP-N-acetylmuramoylalanine-D-glutamate ligase
VGFDYGAGVADGAEQVAVIGAGVSGLTSAACLAEAGWTMRAWASAMPQPNSTKRIWEDSNHARPLCRDTVGYVAPSVTVAHPALFESPPAPATDGPH